uniref:Uncharacterized protein n=1 Tax=Solanum tuberosum TaxID=4113 RepID=M1ACC5_SOLTU
MPGSFLLIGCGAQHIYKQDTTRHGMQTPYDTTLVVDDEPNEEMEEDPEEDPREPTEEMEEDSKGYPEHDPNLYDPRDGGVMHMENKPVPIVEDAHSKYGSIGFDEREDSNNWEWKIDESLEYNPNIL